MIKTDNEYRLTLERIQAQSDRIRQERAACVAEGCTPEEVQRLLDPVECFHAQLREEADSYEKLKKGDFDELKNFHGIGYILIAMRIYQGLSQRELAEKLGVHESQVSRDERNEYRGITVERANRILEALGAELRTNIVTTPRSTTNLSRMDSVLVGN